MNKKVVTFGEIMGRFEPEGYCRLRQNMPGQVLVTFAGSEASVAVSLRIMERDSVFVTALPSNDLGLACLDSVRRFGVDTSHIHLAEGRLGLYFVETGANQRPSNVIYDRENSVISQTPADQYNWKEIFSDAHWFHISGITPALSRKASESALSAVIKAKESGLTVSCDINFRKKLWRWNPKIQPRDLAEKTMREIIPFVDVLIGNEEDAWDLFRINAGNTDVDAGRLCIDKYPDTAREIVRQFPNIQRVAFTLRESISANHNRWGAMMYEAAGDETVFAPTEGNTYSPYDIKNIVDRIGGGDAFSAGLIYALTDENLAQNPSKALSYAVAASCLCHSIKGDFNFSQKKEIHALMEGSSSGRVKR